MTTATAPARPAPARGARSAPVSAWRLLWLELRHSTVPLALPLIAALFWFDSYRPSTPLPPLWIARLFYILGQAHALIDFGPLMAGVSAWIGSREGRRGVSDLVTSTARPRWAAQTATWTATATWTVAAYLVYVSVVFWVFSRTLWGSPPWGPVAVGVAGVAAFVTFGFAVGVYFPNRFAAPLAAFGGFVAMVSSSQTGFAANGGWGMVLPTNSNGNFGADSGIFYHYLPDLPIVRVMFLGGLTVCLLGVIGLSGRDGAQRGRRLAATVVAAGVALSAAGTGLAATAKIGPYGEYIPAIHDAANDRPVPYTPVCGKSGFQVCLHPAYAGLLPTVTSALSHEISDVAGLPGSPVRAVQAPALYDSNQAAMTISGSPPVLRVVLGNFGLPASFGQTSPQLAESLKQAFALTFAGAGNTPGTPVQQAVAAALLRDAGVPLTSKLNGVGYFRQGRSAGAAIPGPVLAAAARLAALSPAAQHAWLAAHLPAVRAGTLPLTALSPAALSQAAGR